MNTELDLFVMIKEMPKVKKTILTKGTEEEAKLNIRKKKDQ